MAKHGKACLHYIRLDKIEPNCEKFNLRTDGQTDTSTSAGVENKEFRNME